MPSLQSLPNVHLFNTYLLSTYCVPSPVLSTLHFKFIQLSPQPYKTPTDEEADARGDQMTSWCHIAKIEIEQEKEDRCPLAHTENQQSLRVRSPKHTRDAQSFYWPAGSHLSLYLMKTWYKAGAPGAARASFISFRKWVCTRSSSYSQRERGEGWAGSPGSKPSAVLLLNSKPHIQRASNGSRYPHWTTSRVLAASWLTSMLTKMISMS